MYYTISIGGLLPSALTLLHSDLYEGLGILKPGLVDMARIIKSSQGPLCHLRKWKVLIESGKSREANVSEECIQLQSRFLASVKQLLLGSRYILWPVFDAR
jgi:hypothetical protein